MSEWNNIHLRDFWDVPHAILAKRGTEQFYFSSRFDDALDDYTPYYEVFRLPLLSEEETQGSWVGLKLRATEKLDNLPLKSLHPIILASDGRVMDGMHRVCKALNENRETISAVQFENDPEPDYIGVHPDDLPYDE